MGPLALAGIGAVAGGVQTLIGGSKGRRARKELENLPTPTYSPAKSISDYYNQALQRFQESPYQSNLYKMQAQNIARGTAQGLSSLQDRRSAMAGIPALIQSQNDALLKAGVTAEQQREQRFGQLGAATEAMAGEQRKAWEVNQMLPYQTKRELLGQKAAGYTQLMNAGLQNMYGSLSGGLYASGLMGQGSGGGVSNSGIGDDGYGYERRMSAKPFTMKTVPTY